MHLNSPQSTAIATKVRWRILLLLMAMTFICHFNRSSISVAGTEKIMKQYDLTEIQMGNVYSAYLLIYTICMIPGGWFIDRFGVKLALFIMSLGTGICAVLTGCVGLVAIPAAVIPGFLVVRALMGLSATPTHPGAARGVAAWTPPRLSSLANGVVVGMALVGIASTYYVFGTMIDRFGWPMAFVITGIATVGLSLLWTAYYTNSPAEHKSVNDAELHLILDGAPHAVKEGETGNMLGLLKNRSLMLITISYAAVGYFQYMFFYWVQYYFKEQMHVSTETSRLYSTITNLSMALGMFLGGWFADRLSINLGRRFGRSAVAMFGMILGTVFLIAGTAASEPVWSVTWFSLAMLCVGLSEGPGWANAIELGARHGGTAAGIFNTGGNIGGMIAPIATPWLADHIGWQGATLVAGAVCVIGAFLWIWVRPDERAAESSTPAAGVAF